jgi:shikimate kinase
MPFWGRQVNGPLTLVGLMGAGKTTVGRQLAKRLGLGFIDLDHEIEARTGVHIPIIFEMEGEVGFREREHRLLADLVKQECLVLATGGGVVLRADNRQLLRENSTVIYLSAQPSVLHERTRRSAHRPLLQVADPLAKLAELHAQRDPLYREIADIVIETRPGPVSQIVKQVEAELKKCIN